MPSQRSPPIERREGITEPAGETGFVPSRGERRFMKIRILSAGLILCVLVASTPASASRRTADPCSGLHPKNYTQDLSAKAFGSGPLRIFAMQYKQEAAYVRTYRSFDTKMNCLMDQYVAPYLDPSKTNLVVFNEDTGLATLATGSRGAIARAIAQSPGIDPPQVSDATGVPYEAAVGLGSVGVAYGRQLAAYRTMFPTQDPRQAIITSATDTFVRGFMTTFSRIARKYHVYIIASNNQSEFHYSTDPADIATFSDPDLAALYATGKIKGVWVASSGHAWNEGFVWGPDSINPAEGSSSKDPSSLDYDPRTNLIYVNKKTPLTSQEEQFLALDDGDMSAANTGPFTLPGLPGFRFGMAISLPAFQWGSSFDQPFTGDPCASSATWMRCLYARGVNIVIQPEANSGPWARWGADGNNFQSLSWGESTIRTVTDSTVPNFKYIVCAHMVGNLLDIPFDGQTAILERGLTGNGSSYVGAWAVDHDATPPHQDSPEYQNFAGLKPEFLALAPWAFADDLTIPIDQDRTRLNDLATSLMPGSGSPNENNYLETAIAADLTTP
ncbi:MAG: hypothetical protein ACYDCC_02810 [Actinomycetota bacterium]